MPVFTDKQLKKMSSAIFEAAGVPKDEAELVSTLLVEANLTGHDSHGVLRIPRYMEGVLGGHIKPGTEISIVRETPSVAVIDGKWGFGQVVASKSMEIAISKAKKTGIGSASVFNCHHTGRMNTYSEMALKHDMIGIAMCNSGPLVAPFGGKDRVLSTNPLTFAVPGGKEKPFVLDMATSVRAVGGVYVKMARGEQCPEGWLITKDGYPTTDPTEISKGGSLLPLGGIIGYKGYGLALFVDMMVGALSEAGCSSSEEYQSRPYAGGCGVFLMAIDIASFTDVDLFRQRVDNLIGTVKTSSVAPGYEEILIPGEPEARSKKERLEKGIFVEETTWQAIQDVAKSVKVDIEKTIN